ASQLRYPPASLIALIKHYRMQAGPERKRLDQIGGEVADRIIITASDAGAAIAIAVTATRMTNVSTLSSPSLTDRDYVVAIHVVALLARCAAAPGTFQEPRDAVLQPQLLREAVLRSCLCDNTKSH
ncbi:hypothetical protein Vretimale_2386, partial [Volvox reticuliferus]